MKKFSFCFFATLFLFACEPGMNPAQEKLLNEITALEKQLLKAEDASKDKDPSLC